MEQKAPEPRISVVTVNIPSSQNSEMYSIHHRGYAAHFTGIPEEGVVAVLCLRP